jgi:hypothetical protein
LKNTLKLLFIFLLVLNFSCKNDSNSSENNLAIVQIAGPIIQIDSLLFEAKNESEILTILQKHKTVSEQYFETNAEKFTELSKKLFTFIQSPELKQFYGETVNKSKIDSIKTALNTAFNYIKADYPNFKAPKIYTFFTGFAGKDMLVNDSTIAIGLDYFGGPEAKYRPQVFDYQINKYQAEYIVPSILNQMAIKYAAIEPSDKSLLADMLFYGKCYQFTKQMLPNAADSLIIGYTQEQLEATETSQEMVWGHFIDEKLLFESNPFKKSKYLDERPNTQEISPDCPGLIGRWLGWKIVKKYLENNPKQNFKALMANPKAQYLFENSNYKGKPDPE